MEAERALNEINLETARNHQRASEKALENITKALDMRTSLLAQMTISILTCAHPKWEGCTVQEAALKAREVLEEVEHPSPEEKANYITTGTNKALATPGPTVPRKSQPMRAGQFYEKPDKFDQLLAEKRNTPSS